MSNQEALAPSRGRNGGERHPMWTVLLASLGAFMTALDALVVTTSLPVLRSGSTFTRACRASSGR